MSTSLFDLNGKVALVTGAAQGLGRAMALALAEAGADLMLVDRNADGTTRTAALIEDYRRRAVVASCDVSDPEQIRSLFRRLDTEFGRIDFLGKVAGDGVLGIPEEISLADVEESWKNLRWGASACVRKQAGACWRQEEGALLISDRWPAQQRWGAATS